MRKWLLVGGMAVAAVLLFLLLRPKPDPGPLQVSLWYWHTPFALSKQEVASLKDLGVTELFVRSSTFTTGKPVQLMLPQTWKTSADGLAVHLTFPFDGGTVKHFADSDPSEWGKVVGAFVLEDIGRAKKAGLKVAGVQLDMDCPTRLLPRYAKALHEVRLRLKPQGLKLSITALPTWFLSGDPRPLVKEVDFVVPQFYENVAGKTLDDVRPISNTPTLRKAMAAIERSGAKYRVGLSSYGRAFMFDEKGAMLGVYHGLSMSDALRHPSFEFVEAYGVGQYGGKGDAKSWSGEQKVVLKAVKSARDGRGLGYRLAFILPTTESLRQQLAQVRKERYGCRGVILYRYPEEGESMSLPVASIASVIKGEGPKLQAEVMLKKTPSPWSLIEGRKKASRPALDLEIVLKTSGNAASFAAPDAVEVTVELDSAGLESLEQGDFDMAQACAADGQKCSLTRASTIGLKRGFVLPGESVCSGAIQVSPGAATKARVRWSIRLAGGFEKTGGETEWIDLWPKKAGR